MITAAEAVKLYQESGHEVDQFLEHKVKPVVTVAAMLGKRIAFIHLDSIKQHGHLYLAITPLQQAVVDKLVKLGYNAVIKIDGEPYVPRGLADDDGNGPTHQNYGISIRW